MREDYAIDEHANAERWETVKLCANKYKESPKNEELKRKYVTALHLAIAKGQYEVVNSLLFAGTPQYGIGKCDDYGYLNHLTMLQKYDSSITPLHLAAGLNDSELFKLLAKHGGDLSLTDSSGKTPIEYFAIASNWKFLETLIEQYPPTTGLFQTDIYHYSQILILAVKAKQYEIVKILLEAGVSQIADSETGNTPLHFAMINDDIGMLQLLLAYKANKQAKNKFGEIPIQLMGFNIAMAVYQEAKDSEFKNDRNRLFTQKDIQIFEGYIDEIFIKAQKEKLNVELRKRYFTLGQICLFKIKSNNAKLEESDFITAITFLILSGNKTSDGIWHKERCYISLNDNVGPMKPGDPIPLKKPLVLKLIKLFSAYPQDEMQNEIGELYAYHIGDFDKACEIWKSISKTSPDAVNNIILLIESGKITSEQKALLAPVIPMGHYFGVGGKKKDEIKAIELLREACNVIDSFEFECLKEIAQSKDAAVSGSAKKAIAQIYLANNNLTQSAFWAFDVENNDPLSEEEKKIFCNSEIRKSLDLLKIVQVIKNNKFDEEFLTNALLLDLINEENKNLKTFTIASEVLQNLELYGRLKPVEVLQLYCNEYIRKLLPEKTKHELLYYFIEHCLKEFVTSTIVFSGLQEVIQKFEWRKKEKFLKKSALAILQNTSTRNHGFKNLFNIFGRHNFANINNIILEKVISAPALKTSENIFKISYLYIFLNIHTKPEEVNCHSPFGSLQYDINILSDLYNEIDFIDISNLRHENPKEYWKKFLREKALSLVKDTALTMPEMEKRSYLGKVQHMSIFQEDLIDADSGLVDIFHSLFSKTDAVNEIQLLSIFSSSRFLELSLKDLCKIVDNILTEYAGIIIAFPHEASKKLIKDLTRCWNYYNQYKDNPNNAPPEYDNLKKTILENICNYMKNYENNKGEKIFEIIKQEVKDFLYVEEFKEKDKIFEAIKNNNKPFFIDFLKSLTGKHDQRLNQFHEKGLRLIDLAVLFNRPDMVQLLIEYGAEFKTYNKTGSTALHYAVGNGNIEITKLLVNKGAFISAKDHKGKTPLHYAAEVGDIETCRYLISKRADIEIKDKDRKKPEDYLSDENKLVLKKDISEVQEWKEKMHQAVSAMRYLSLTSVSTNTAQHPLTAMTTDTPAIINSNSNFNAGPQ